MTTFNDRYDILDELGHGGMATVYRARDRRHGRDVAVKVMLPAVAASIGAGRFLSEIEIAARLQHPQIVPVFDSGNDHGQLYFVMPLIEGESLREKLVRERQLPVSEAVRLVREVAEALEYAHSQGVLHRDLKPENILLSRGHALLSDFGIARAPASAGSEGTTQLLTQAGALLGTPAYMSPEQASGERNLGPASDVYSLGCVLFELLAGEAPFKGGTLQESLVRRFTTEAPRVRSVRADTPAACDAAVAKAMARDLSQRFASALTFADALAKSVERADARDLDPVGDRSIAVVPFDNLSPDPNDAYLADGLTEELITDLAKIPALRVIARNSSVAARQRTGDLKEIARILDVRYLLEGSVRRAGTQLRITAQLIDGTTDAHLWAEKYAGTMDDVFEMQEQISRTIVEGLRVRLDEAEPPKATVADIEAYELYLRAKHYAGQSVMKMPEAMACLEECMRRDPQFAPAFCAMGALLIQAAFFGFIKPRPVWERVQALARQAIALAPRSGAAHELLASVAIYRDRNWTEARRLYRQAAELEPGIGFDRIFHAWFLAFSGEIAAAVREAQAGRRLDPLSFFGQVTEAAMHLYAGDWDESLRHSDRLIAFDPQFPEGYHIKGYLLLVRGEHAQALPVLEQAMALSHRASWPMAKVGCALAALGRETESRVLLAELEQRAETEPISPTAVATLHLHLGDRRGFYRWMDRALEDGDPFALSIERERLWDSARAEPAFRELKRRIGLPN
ncbi:MAG TPA: protein kinase [Candidatus Udaeobacter sp.]|nr:protein kinase [Candidatus Udaeobacter sp.]